MREGERVGERPRGGGGGSGGLAARSNAALRASLIDVCGAIAAVSMRAIVCVCVCEL